MIKATVFVDRDVLDALSAAARSAPKLTETAVSRQVSRRARQLRAELRTEPKQPALPFMWSTNPVKNARARRWYFANKVALGSSGGRYQRTGNVIKRWKLVTTPSGTGGTLITLENDAPGARFVVGDRQVPSHEQSGWPQIDELAFRYSQQLTDDLIEVWFTIADPFAGTKG